ncbi:ATP-binding protein [Actinoplanes sp. NPDC026670]|uniref:sensor histidine kinase n=1 Tax=Actinoplanes sp. NPDC026670 TaxID=3154700 RepID=UPI00340E7E46
MPRNAGLRRISLQTKLVASVLVLVLAALTLISAASTYFLSEYMVSRMDSQLWAMAEDAAERSETHGKIDVYVPPDYLVAFTTVGGVFFAGDRGAGVDAGDAPPLLAGVDAITRQADRAYTDKGENSKYMWRMLVVVLPNGLVMHIGQRMKGVDDVIARLVLVDVLVGVGVLITLATVGAALVRQSLIPLRQVERTAAAIAAGDLTRRVPDPEESGGHPTTELGRLSEALNAMLAQIEAAFRARADSEQAARFAADAAQQSEARALASESRALQSEGKMRQFVADASHELRTPLTTIRGFAELYRQGAVSDPEQVASLVRRIEDEAARMGLLVEDLLLLARLDRERPLTLAPVELPVLAMDAVEAAQATAPERTIELEVRDSAERLVAYGDDARLRQVVGNLMTNALVHTPPDAPVTLRLYAGEGNVAVVEVSDGGPGLSEAQTRRVFERFYRVDEARTRNTEREATGTGLGLAIVAAIVRAHEGSVQVISEAGQGATFRVSLPTINPDKGFTENVQE